MQILVIEDDKQTAAMVGQALRADGHTVDVEHNGDRGLKAAALGGYDVLVVDRMLPVIDGVSVVQSLRNADVQSRVIFLTARGGIEDRIEGLLAGGDDYLTKPFALGELLARVNVLGRRLSSKQDALLRVADLELNLITRVVTRDGQIISLQPREYKILEVLMRNKGRVLTKRMLLEQVWDLNFDPETSVVPTNISRLRAKIDRPCDIPLLHTIRGVGYRIDDPS